MQRREFVKLGALGIISAPLYAGFDTDYFLGIVGGEGAKQKPLEIPKTEAISDNATFNDERFLWLIRGNEQFKETYYVGGKYDVDAYKRFCWLMRDQRDENGFVAIDASLMNLLYRIQNTLVSHGLREPIRVNSGYRSPRTNAATEGAAKNSFHTKGKAVDITIANADTGLLGALGVVMERGGVGFYPNKNFIHLDTGSVRSWSIGSDGVMRGV